MIRVTQAEYLRDHLALTARASATKQSIEVVDEAGNVRMQVDLGTGEPEADPDDAGGEAGIITVSVDAAMLAALTRDGVPPSVRAAFVLREVYGLWGSPVGAKAAE